MANATSAAEAGSDVLQVVFRLNRAVRVDSKPVVTAAGTKSTYFSRYGTTSRCYSADIPAYDPKSALARARAGDTLPVTLRSRSGRLLASTTVIARDPVDRATLYRLAEQIGCQRPTKSQTQPGMTLSTGGVTRKLRGTCINDNTERTRGTVICDLDPRGTLPIRAGQPITIRVPGKITGVALRDFDAATDNAPLLDDPRPRRARGRENRWTVRVPSRLDPRTNYLGIQVLLPRRNWVSYEINVRRVR